MKKKMFLIFAMIVLVVALFPLMKADVCCERTTDGATCVNAPEIDCNSAYRIAKSSCEATAFCKTGTCINSIEGTCMPNTPKVICDEAGGLWEDKPKDEIDQCNLGCCYVGEGAVFTTQTRCSSLASIYNLDVDYRTDITNELECIASAESTAKGACVISNDYETTCRFLTQQECSTLEASSSSSGLLSSLFQSGSTDISETTFYEGYLCSAEELGADCGPAPDRTTCVEGKNQVYFLDTCGNLANVYDASRAKDADYWTKIINYKELCGYDEENANSASCGNCNYPESICGSYDWKEGDTKPTYGDYTCKDLTCEYEGETYRNSEEWCETFSETDDNNKPGSRHYVLSCYLGEIGIEPCADARQEFCLQGDTSVGYSSAGCVPNLWQNCYAQITQEDCEDSILGDCTWMNGSMFLIDENQVENGYCIPTYAPGLDFWQSEEKETVENEEYCAIGSTTCIVQYETGFEEQY